MQIKAGLILHSCHVVLWRKIKPIAIWDMAERKQKLGLGVLLVQKLGRISSLEDCAGRFCQYANMVSCVMVN